MQWLCYLVLTMHAGIFNNDEEKVDNYEIVT